jgi:molybdopterin synthase catalytic subunit
MPLHFAHTVDEFSLLTKRLDEPWAGGFVNFNGRVRRFNHHKEVAYLYYEAHITLAQSMFANFEDEAKTRFHLLQSAAVHRLHRVDVGQDAIGIMVAAPHRHEAFLAARFLIDELKMNLPIWKKEVYKDGSHSFGQNNCIA